MPLDGVIDDAITLKLNGKAFSCQAKTGRRRCKGKHFIRMQDGALYACVKCSGLFDGNGFEEQLPPRNDWRTPQRLWETLNREYRFTLDPCTDVTNSKCSHFFTEEHSGLTNSWAGFFWYCTGCQQEIYAERSGHGAFKHCSCLRCLQLRQVEPTGGIISAERCICPRCGVLAECRSHHVFVNCPYQPKGAVEAWLQKGLEQAALGVRSVFLIPMSTSVAWFNDLVVPFAEWHSFRGRIAFEDPLADATGLDGERAERTSPKQDNLLVIYRPDSTIIGHAAVRDAKTGERLWTRPDLLQ